MNKESGFYKFLKALPYIAIAVLVYLYFNSRQQKATSSRESTYDTLCVIADEISTIGGQSEDAYLSEDYETMSDTLYGIEEKCRELSTKVEDLAYQFADRDSDYDGRRSWWY